MKAKTSKTPAAPIVPAICTAAAVNASTAANRLWGEYMRNVLQSDAEAAAYINAVIDEGDSSGLIIALRRLSEARGDLKGAVRP